MGSVTNYKILNIKILREKGRKNTKVADKKFIMILIIQVLSYGPSDRKCANSASICFFNWISRPAD